MSAQQHGYADGRASLPIFIDRQLDDLGLNPYQFRIYARIARRAGEKGAYESIKNMAIGCQMSEGKVKSSLRMLVDYKLVTKESQLGGTSIYRLTDRSEWVTPDKNSLRSKRGHGTTQDVTDLPTQDVTDLPTQDVTDLPTQDVTDLQRYSIEGPPIEGSPIEEKEDSSTQPMQLVVYTNGSLDFESIPEPSRELDTNQSLAKSVGVARRRHRLLITSIVPALFENNEQLNSKIQKYRQMESDGIKLNKPELLDWANIELGEYVRTYRKSGCILTGGNDVSHEFAIYVAGQNCRKGQEPTIALGFNVINKCESDPRSWQKLVAWVVEWRREIESGGKVNIAMSVSEQQELKRVHDASKKRFEL